MKRFRDISVRQKLTYAIVATGVVPLLIATALLLGYEWRSMRGQLVRDAQAQAEMLAPILKPSLDFIDSKRATDTLATLRQRDEVIAAAVYTPDGARFASYTRAGSQYVSFPPPAPHGYVMERRHVDLFHSIGPANDVGGHLYIRWDMEPAMARLPKYLGMVGVILLGLLLVVLWFSFEFRRVISDPILELAEASRRVRDAKDAAIQMTRRGNDEIGQLSDSFNQMLQRIREREADLKQSELRKGAILDTALDGIITIDHEGRVIEFNPAAQQIFGIDREKIIGREMAAVIVPEAYREKHRQGLKHYLATKEGPALGRRVELSALRSDGTEFPIELSITRIGSDEPPTFTGFIRDITERKRAEAALRELNETLEQRVADRTAAAEAANKAKSEFLANMSHEIRTPMNGIIGMTELLLHTKLTPEQREYQDMVRRSADSLLSLLNDILDFSKIEAGRLDLDPHECPLRDTLGDTVQALALRASEKGLELACHIYPDVPDILVVDASRLRQILINLIGNAIKFTHKGEVLLAVRVEENFDDKVRLHFSVKDTGIGIPKEKQELIFGAFSQADASTSRHFGGTGLGLAISSRLVRLMQGKLWVESESGRGSTFHFTITVEVKAAATPRATPDQLHALPVLVVDDNATNRRILEELLRNWDMQPCLTASGEEALVALENASSSGHPFQLVLLDAMMPGMDGIQLADRIRRHHQLGGVRMLMLSSAGPALDLERTRALNIARCLTKPVKHSELLNAIVLAMGVAATEAGVHPQAGEQLARATQSLKLLLAEDSPVNQRVALRLLERRGHSVSIANNGTEAVAAVTREDFDLVLMDVHMPEMDGFQATGAIRALERERGGHIPIVAMTANAMKGDREHCMAAGMDDYISKPIRSQELFEVVERMAVRKDPAVAEG